MKKEQTMGLLREVLTALGALAFAGFAGWPSVAGLIVAIASIVWAMYYNEGAESVYTLVRKLLSTSPAVGVELGLLSTSQASSLVALLLPLGAMVWSYYSKQSSVTPKSQKYPLWILLPILAFLLTPLLVSCGGVRITPDGCLLGTYTSNGTTYLAGPCVGNTLDEDGHNQVDRFRVQWENPEGQELRATYWVKADKPVQIEYKIASGLWLSWDAKSGVMIGPVPPEVEKAMEGAPEPVIIETPIVEL